LSVAPTSGRLLGEILPLLVDCLKLLEEELDEVRKGGGAVKLARAFVALHQIKETVNAIHGKDGGLLNKFHNRFKSIEVPAVFDGEDLPHVPLNEGFRVGLSTRIRASLPAANRQRGFEWLRANGLPDLVQETVNAETLSSTAQLLMEEQNLELPADIFTTYEVRNTSVTKL